MRIRLLNATAWGQQSQPIQTAMLQDIAEREERSARSYRLRPQTWQFQLRHLFGLTTIAAIGAALVAAYGAGALLTSVGLLIAWLNQSGAFEHLQTGRRQTALVWLAWVLFLVSLALPSVRVFGPVLGFWAAWFAVVLPVDSMRQGEPMKPGLALFLAINIANFLIAVLPMAVWRPNCPYVRWFMAALCITMVAPWCVCWSDTMLVGYYVWCASFLIALIAFPVRSWTLIAMVAATVASGLASQ